ncbi:AP endonuclease, family 2 [Aeromicrobium marinum DSM 15272]|uniref:AP endonuclease, family 2 n=1 Tax=Aeromicrobium marinum DSM 15272 TaxID=585531 RepID=E2SC26_9ACTN|nr:sugar phosphate isomerase/epimerase family protein [Aeromicrobium marinum]EFQ83312.1 AP endonuclease, family 2 [Aeromicrobium marinum DSM 15272]
MSDPLRVSLSSSSVYPGSTASAFEAAARLGYDGVEVMVGIDDVSADIDAVVALSEFHQMPVVSVHAPTLLLTQRVWGTDPWGKLHRSADMARAVGATTIVVHPPFRWQRDYALEFEQGIADLEAEHGLVYAVENMYPWRTGKREFQAYAPGWDPVVHDYAHVTVDLSHSGTARQDPVQMVRDLGPRLAHVHIADSLGSAKDEHLIPGRGSQPCGEFLRAVADSGYTGEIVVEVNTRKALDARTKEADLLEALAFSRLHTS